MCIFVYFFEKIALHSTCVYQIYDYVFIISSTKHVLYNILYVLLLLLLKYEIIGNLWCEIMECLEIIL